MKKISKLLPLLSVPILVSTFCTGCGNNSITVTINGGTGTFKDLSFIKSFSINRGSKLKDCKFEAPILDVYSIDYHDDGIVIPRPVLYYTTEDGKKYDNTPIKSNTVLYAHYYDSFDDEQLAAKKFMGETYDFVHKFIPDRTDIDEIYYETINKIDSSTTSYQIFTYEVCYDSLLKVSPQLGQDTFTTMSDIVDHYAGYVEDLQNDQRLLSIAKMMNGFLAMSIMRHDDETLSNFKTLADIQMRYIDGIDPNCASYYGVPFDALIRATAQQPKTIQLNSSLGLFAEAYMHIHDVYDGAGLAMPLVGMTAAAVMQPNLVPKYNELYTQIVKEILNN